MNMKSASQNRPSGTKITQSCPFGVFLLTQANAACSLERPRSLGRSSIQLPPRRLLCEELLFFRHLAFQLRQVLLSHAETRRKTKKSKQRGV